MDREEVINAVANGAKFTVNFQKRTCRLNGEVVMKEGDFEKMEYTHFGLLFKHIEELYENYKHSVPSERSESHRHSYFKALPEKELTDEDMMYGEPREVARCKLETYVLLAILKHAIWWKDEWGSWFWQSPTDKDLVILRDWIEPNKGGK